MPEGDEKIYQDPASKPVNKKPEDGEFFRLAHSVCEALFEVDELTKTQIKIILYIARMTWGWNRPRFEICQKTASERLGIHKSLMSRSFNALVKSDVLMTQKGEVGINKYREQWNLELLVQLNNTPKQKEALRNRQQLTILPTVDDFTNSELTILPTPTGLKPADNADSGDPYRHTIDTNGDLSNSLNTSAGGSANQPTGESKIFRTIQATDGVYVLTVDQVETWRNELNHRDVEAEIARALVWHEAAPVRNKKTIRGFKSFLAKWLIRSQTQRPRNSRESVMSELEAWAKEG